MTTDVDHDLTDEERALFRAYGQTRDLAASCRALRDMGVSVSNDALNTLMTEF